MSAHEVGISDADLEEARRQVRQRKAMVAILTAMQVPGPHGERALPDGRTVIVDPLIGGRARLNVGRDPLRSGYDDGW